MKTLFLIVITLLISGCEYIEVASCNDTLMTEVHKGDVLKKDEESTRVKLTHTQDTKNICVSKGSAHIFRR